MVLNTDTVLTISLNNANSDELNSVVEFTTFNTPTSVMAPEDTFVVIPPPAVYSTVSVVLAGANPKLSVCKKSVLSSATFAIFV